MPVGRKSLERAEGTVSKGKSAAKPKAPAKPRTKKAAPVAAEAAVEAAAAAPAAPVTADTIVPSEKTWQAVSHIHCDLPDYLL